MKECTTCNTVKPLSDFYVNNALSDGLTTKCKSCFRDYGLQKRAKARENKPKDWKKKTVDMKSYMDDWKAKNPQYSTLKTKEWYQNNKERLRIKYAVKYALQTGKIKRIPCMICGNENVEGHHPDYSRPIDVVWLCKKHHEEIHHSL